jgi:glycosyltransferase involved in cell wall biosynthesis|tara:strand:- start:353 stop:1564 length:1212 start_codon:yes stop_codon:yes gene_type:complete
MNLISFILPSRNNLKYLKQAYRSIRKNSEHQHEICIASDASTDGTVEWVQKIMKEDENVKLHINEGPERLGHTILYDTLIYDYATHDRVMIFHADMYLCPKADEEIDKYLEPGKVVSLTRIEPPLHPDGPEKVLVDFGIEPEEFDEEGLLEWVNQWGESKEKVTDGIFAPWCIMKDDFTRINGHDPLFAPQSKEDSDIFNRFMLAGYEFIQTWEGYVYHMTCRGSRFKDGAKRNPDGQVFMKNRETDEWLIQNLKSTRNFIRKWGSMVKHNEYLKPIIPPKYDIGLIIKNCTYDILYALEPYCNQLYLEDTSLIDDYLKEEGDKSGFDLGGKLLTRDFKPHNDVLIEFDALQMTQESYNIFLQFPDILGESGEPNSDFILDIFKIKTKLLDNQVDLLVNSVQK